MSKESKDALRMIAITPGYYRHYKGGRYQVVFLAIHSETLEVMVVYRELYGERGVWVRPLEMFCEEVEIDGKLVPRFKRLEEPKK